MQGQNSSPLWWKVMDKVTIEFSYIPLPLEVPCAGHFTKSRLFSTSEPRYLQNKDENACATGFGSEYY